MRRTGIALVLLITLSAGCTPTPGRTFEAAFPFRDGRVDGSVDVQRLPITLHDLTETVEALAIAEPAQIAGGALVAVAPIANQPNVVRVDWLAGVCEGRVRMVLSRGAVGYGLVIRSESSMTFPFLGGGCPAAAILRAVEIRFVEPVDATDFSVSGPSED